MRMLHEVEKYEHSVFVTLTYNDLHLPANNTLVKADLQKYFKRLRKSLDVQRRIKYYAVGEYGDLGRPHYHAIIFGLSLDRDDKKKMKDAWPYGYCYFGLAEPDSIQYVAGYIDKKWSGKKAKEEYDDKNRIPVFRLSSLGLGRDWLEKNRDQIIKRESMTYRGVPVKIPRYYLNKLGDDIDKESISEKAYESETKLIKEIIGLDISRDEALHQLSDQDNHIISDTIYKSNAQRDRELQAKCNLRKRKL